ncbi:hypothetical protein BCR39DRAFT_551848 [Naematelia encephala]|uniref:CHAT domain-containing protein n=1 Tax=Naematelia encephala TaxID=71784 RepID=A0A1Y2AIB5_9TREE|nr:hypothetical protein BCR39DRAFT_551848 [Naematelia encephala]
MDVVARRYDGGWRDSFVLACGASPATSTPLQLAQEFTETEVAVRQVSDVYSMWHTNRAFVHRDWTTVDTLRDNLIRYRPIVLHISSHAAEFEILLAKASATSQHQSLSLHQLRNIVTVLRNDIVPYPEVIVLNCCCTQAVAEALANVRSPTSPNHGPFVIGTRRIVHDERAVAFTREFYRSLASGSSLGEAFELAQATSDDGVYFLQSGGRGINDLETAKNYHIPPKDSTIFPFPNWYRRERNCYALLVRGARRPLTFATYHFIGESSGHSVAAAGMEFTLADLPPVGAEQIAGFGTEADAFLQQAPRRGVSGKSMNARYFLNHLRAITGERRGPCLFAHFQGKVYYEHMGAWREYASASNFDCRTRDPDPVRWRDVLPFE